MKFGEVNLEWLGHAGFLITSGGVSSEGEKNSRIIYIDPYNIREDSKKADVILLTHSHYDHCSIEDMNKIIKDGTRIVMTADCQSNIARFDVPIKMEVIGPGQEINLLGMKISAVPSYNVDKHFHSKEEHWVGYLIKIGKVLIYHAGDSDLIPEMHKLTGHKKRGVDFVALLPIGGRFTMSAEEAAEAAKIIKPTIAIPMHYGSIVGSQEDAEEFAELCKEYGIETKILEKS